LTNAKFHRKTIWRGIKGNVSNEYKKGSKITWWGFTSCTIDLETAKKFLKEGEKTLFNIHFEYGFDISAFSSVKEKEIVLPPARHFEVLNSENLEKDLYLVELKEILLPVPLIDFQPKHIRLSD
jgi:hypothetical protein